MNTKVCNYRLPFLGSRSILAATSFFSLVFAFGAGSARSQDQLPPPPLPSDPNAASVAPAMPNDPNAEVLARGPVHEAFATPAGVDPSPGFIIPRQPPQVIEEAPPEVKPAGENVSWIPGYWGWDDDRKDFLWVSGVWRQPPPGFRWLPGYWQPAPNGFQWVSGHWMPNHIEQVSYLPAPPALPNAAPAGAAPGPNYFWVPAHYEWQNGTYVLAPGYYAPVQPNWIFTPASYYWTPRGYAYVPGHWDYTFETRGLCYSPVYFRGPVAVYRPAVCVDVGVFSFSLFARPAYCHYYFGDYYDGAYVGLGFSPWYARPYDPFFAYYRWDHVYYRHEAGWDVHLRGWGDYYRGHPDMRPPHTYAAQVALMNSPAGRARADFHQLGFVQSSREFARDPHAFVHVAAVSPREAAAIRESVHETRNFSAQRQNLEAHGGIARGEEHVNYNSMSSFHSANLPGAAAAAGARNPANGAQGNAQRQATPPPHPVAPPARPKQQPDKRQEDRRTEVQHPERTFAGSAEKSPANAQTPERRTPVVVERRPVEETKPAPAHTPAAESRHPLPPPPAHAESKPAHGGSEPAGNHREKDNKN